MRIALASRRYRIAGPDGVPRSTAAAVAPATFSAFSLCR
jgi:hypothetical protein